MKKVDHYNILLVEDEQYLRRALKNNIEEIDDVYKVTAEASNGLDAMDVLKRESVHVIFTDIQMPEMNGLELSKQVKLLYPDIPVVILTGYSDFNYMQEALRQQVFDYLLKPVSEDDLAAVLSKVSSELEKIYELPEETLAAGSDARSYVKQVAEYIREHYMEDIDLGSLAGELGFSAAYLSKIFKRYAGMTPVKMLTDVRIHQAKRLLLETGMSIQEVGAQVGYPDQFHFSKTFRKVVGINPSRYRAEGGETGAEESDQE